MPAVVKSLLQKGSSMIDLTISYVIFAASASSCFKEAKNATFCEKALVLSALFTLTAV